MKVHAPPHWLAPGGTYREEDVARIAKAFEHVEGSIATATERAVMEPRAQFTHWSQQGVTVHLALPIITSLRFSAERLDAPQAAIDDYVRASLAANDLVNVASRYGCWLFWDREVLERGGA